MHHTYTKIFSKLCLAISKTHAKVRKERVWSFREKVEQKTNKQTNAEKYNIDNEDRPTIQSKHSLRNSINR